MHWIAEVAHMYPACLVGSWAVALMGLLALIEGGFVLAKAQRDASVLIDLLDQYRAQIEVALEIEPGAPNPPGGA
jgi:hypothetical protein